YLLHTPPSRHPSFRAAHPLPKYTPKVFRRRTINEPYGAQRPPRFPTRSRKLSLGMPAISQPFAETRRLFDQLAAEDRRPRAESALEQLESLPVRRLSFLRHSLSRVLKDIKFSRSKGIMRCSTPRDAALALSAHSRQATQQNNVHARPPPHRQRLRQLLLLRWTPKRP